MVEVAKMAALTPVHDSKVPRLVRPVDVHKEVPGPFSACQLAPRPPETSKIVQETKSHASTSIVVPRVHGLSDQLMSRGRFQGHSSRSSSTGSVQFRPKSSKLVPETVRLRALRPFTPAPHTPNTGTRISNRVYVTIRLSFLPSGPM